MSDGESLQPRSVPMDGTARKAERYAHGSAQIAEACAAAICNGQRIDTWLNDSSFEGVKVTLTEREVAERIAKTLDAIHANTHEAGSRSS